MSPLAVVLLVLAIAVVAQGFQLASLRRSIRHVDVTAGRALWNSADAKVNANKALGNETPRTTFTEGIGR